MKQGVKIATITVAAALSVSTAQAAVQSQTDLIKSKLAAGDYSVVADNYNRRSRTVRITQVTPDKAQLAPHVEVEVQPFPNDATKSTRKTRENYFADNIAFPVTYRRSVYEGNNKLQKKVGYSLRTGRWQGEKDRLVVAGDYLFFLNDWRDKDNYTISRVLKLSSGGSASGSKVVKKSLGGLFGALTQAATGGAIGASIESLKADVLQPYLDQATSQQQAIYPTWKAKTENAKRLQYLEDKRNLMNKAMRQYNDKIFNSPEHQRMLAFHRWMAKNINVEVVNNTGREVWIGSKTSPYYVGINNGSSSTQTCTGDLYYHLSKDSTSGIKFYNADSACGSKVNIR